MQDRGAYREIYPRYTTSPPLHEYASVRAPPTHTHTLARSHDFSRPRASERATSCWNRNSAPARPRRTVYISAPAGVPWRHFIQTWSRPNTKIRTWPQPHICRSIFSRTDEMAMVGGWPGRKYDEQTRVWHMCDDNVVFFSSFFFDLKLQYIDYIRIQGVDIVRSEDINLNEIYIYILLFFAAI